MITQYCMKLDKAVPCSAGYSLYAELLRHAPGYFGDLVHNRGLTPVSQYVVGDEWFISLLGEEAELAMAGILETLEQLELEKFRQSIRITSRRVQYISCVEELLNVSQPSKLILRTPTAFKSQNAYQLLPTQRLLLQSLIHKWNGFFGDFCPVDDTPEALDTLSHALVYRGIHLESSAYNLKNTVIPGVLGSIRIKSDPTDIHHQLIAVLLHFGKFSGVGIKTALGMGGFALE